MRIMRFKTLLPLITALVIIFLLGCTNNSEIKNQKGRIDSYPKVAVLTPKPTITPIPTRVSNPIPTRSPRLKPNNPINTSPSNQSGGSQIDVRQTDKG